ncbi:MAG: DUF1566 domain-containing protein [Candidatus Berkelbacteria bacterium]
MKKRNKFIIAAVAVLLCAGVFGTYKVFAEQSGSTPESGVTSRMKTLYTDLTGLTFGSDSDTPDWGTYWNRIKTAAKWTPSTTAGAGDVSSTKTFTANGSRSATSGTYNLGNLSVGTVKSGTLFGVGLTGQYPSATYPLTGAGTVAGAGDVKSGKVAWSNDGTQISGNYAPVSGGPCSTDVLDPADGGTTGNNCSLTFTTNSSPVTGDDNRAGNTNKDPLTGLTWSQYLKNNAGVIQFVASGGSSWTWNATGAANVAVGNKTAAQLCNSSANPAGAGVWRLPTQNELMQVFIDGAYWNLTQPSYTFWSATENSVGSVAWYVNLAFGTTDAIGEGYGYDVRCVR